MKSFLLSVLFSLFLLFGQAQFTVGNLAFLQADTSASNTTASIVEISPTTASQTAGISTFLIDGTGSSPLRFSGSATSTAYLANSNDGTLLCFTGGNTTNTIANINTITARGVGTLNNAQTFSLATTYTGGNGDQTRAATTLNNSTFYIGDQGGLFTNGASSASPSGNFRSVKPFGGTVYGFTASASAVPVFTISAPSGGTITSLPGLANGATSRQDFYLLSSGANGTAYDVLYVLDATSGTAGTIFKYSLASGSWTSNGSYTTNFGGFGLAAKANGTGAFLYASTGTGATTANRVVRLADVAGYNTAINITTASNITLYTAPAGKVIKGVAFAPLPARSVIANPNAPTFGNVLVGAASTAQTIALTASGLNPASGSLTITSPSTDFQVANDGATWGSSTTVAYVGNGSTIGNFQIRFSPQTSGAKSGNVTITGGGLSNPVNILVSGTGNNSLSFTPSIGTTIALSPPYISGTINDPNDPAMVSGIITDVKQSGVALPAANYTITAVSSNTAVVPNANISITKADGAATIKINPSAVGYSTVTLTLSNGTDSKDYVLNYAASQSSSSTTTWLTGISNASTAIALDDDYMVIGDDETNLLYVYNRKQPGLPAKTYDFNQGNILALTDGTTGAYKELDVEASVRGVANPARMYFLGSMSNSSSFNNKPNRDRLFAVTATGTGAATAFSNVGNYATLRSQLVARGDFYGYNFTASAAAGVDPKTINGFNIEGMCFGPDNTTLYIGFRAPLVPTGARTKAVIAPVQNFEAWFNNGNPIGNPTIGAPIELNLGGRGIRELYRLSNGSFVIVAGSYDGTPNPAIYAWTGVATDAPVAQPAFNITGINAEAVLPINEGGQLSLTKLQVIADDGNMVYYGDGVEASNLTQANFSKFSADVIVSPSAILPIRLEYFTATKTGVDVMLNWQTASVDDGIAFDILRSNNGVDFTTIRTVAVVANRNTYSFNDVNVPTGKLYYRIATKSADGQKLLSAIRVVNPTGVLPLVKVYPSPVVNNIFSVETINTGNKKLGIYNSAGGLYRYVEYNGTIKDIYTDGWPRGTYLLQIIADGSLLPVQKIVVL